MIPVRKLFSLFISIFVISFITCTALPQPPDPANLCNPSPCTGNSECKLNDGQYVCECKPGYEKVSGTDHDPVCRVKTCKEIDCGPNGDCQEGSGEKPPTCVCGDNFVTDGEGCTHVCQSGQQICSNHATCVRDLETNGYDCKCDDGFSFDEDMECVEDQCPDRMKRVEGKCVAKKCSELSLVCPSNQECKEPSAPNEVASCSCKDGFTPTTVKGVLTCLSSDVDESCGKNGYKNNVEDDDGKIIGFECKCKDGWEGEKCEQEKKPVPIEPCRQIASCPANRTCHGNAAVTEANTCPNCADGYELKGDECLLKNPCDGQPESVICKRLDQHVPKLYTLFCPRGFVMRNEKCEKSIQTCSPIIASERGCQQDCSVDLDPNDEKGYKVTCKCFSGYQIAVNGKSCEMKPDSVCVQSECKKKDTNSICVVDPNDPAEGSCQCERGFVKHSNGTCVDYCQPDVLTDDTLKSRIKHEIRSICGATIVRCESKTASYKECPECPPDHVKNLKTGFCDMIDPCSPGEIGVTRCKNQSNKVCQRDIASYVAPFRSAYKCSCEGGFAMDTSIRDNPCRDQEKIEKFIKMCSNLGQVPRRRLTAEEPSCECENPTHINMRNSDGHYICVQPEFSIMVRNFKFSLNADDYYQLVQTGKFKSGSMLQAEIKLNCNESPDPEGCSRYTKLMDAEKDENGYSFYSPHQREEVKIMAVNNALNSSLTGTLRKKFEISHVLIQDTEEADPNLFKSTFLVVTNTKKYGNWLQKAIRAICVNTTLNKDSSCVLNNQIIVRNLNQESSFRLFDECADDRTPNRKCERTGDECTCKCDEGYEPDDNGVDVNNRDLQCTDINECEQDSPVCPENSECSNTPGSYLCKCISGMKETSPLKPKGDGKCVTDYCHEWTCLNGGTQEATFDEQKNENGCKCNCPKGWKGDRCHVEALEPSWELSGWSEVKAARNPDIGQDEQYFYVDVHSSKLHVDPHFTKADVADIEKMVVSFDYWTDSNSITPETDQPFELRFEQCFHLRTYRPSKWFEYSRWHKYNSEVERPLHSEVLDCLNNATLVIQLKQGYSSFVAIKNFKITYSFKGKRSDVLELKCTTPENCVTSFINTEEKIKWSSLGRRPDGTNFLSPEKSGDKLILRFKNMNRDPFYDATIKFKYWINSANGKVSLMLADSTFLDLFRTRLFPSDSQRIAWFEGTIKFSDLAPSLTKVSVGDDITDIVFLPEITGDYHATLIGMKFEIEIDPKSFNPNDRKSMISNVTRKTLGKAIEFIDPVVGIPRVVSGSTSVQVQIVPDNDITNTSYTLFSSWIKASKSPLEFSARVDHESFYDEEYETSIELQMLELENGGNWRREKITEVVFKGLKRRQDVGLLSAIVQESEKDTLRKFVIKVTTKKPTEKYVSVILSDIGFGDACMFDPCNTKRKNNKCINKGPGEMECICDNPNTGALCDWENYCHTNQGSEYCKGAGKGKGPNHCKSLQVPDNLPRNKTYECVCDNEKEYWDTSKMQCTIFSECLRLISCPETGTKCNDTPWRHENPCPDCQEGFIREEKSNKCVKEDICQKECGNEVSCYKLQRTPNLAPEAICYCPNGFTMSSEGGRMSCKRMIKDNECPEIFRVSAGCHHGCETSQPKNSIAIEVKCNCLPGYKLGEDGKSCEPDNISTDQCCVGVNRTNQICIAGSGHTVCRCAPGFKGDPEKDSCEEIDPCGNLYDIETFCGKGVKECSVSNSQINCTCPSIEYKTVQFEAGSSKPFGCSLFDPCDGKDEERLFKRTCAVNITDRVPFTKSYYRCAPGKDYDLESAECVDQCELRENIVECVRQNKVCQTNPLSIKPQCVCQPGFVEVLNSGTGQTRCELSEKSVMGARVKVVIPQAVKYEHRTPKLFNFQCENYPDTKGCLERIQQAHDYVFKNPDVINEEKMLFLEEQLKQGMSIIYSGSSQGFQGISLMNRDYSLIDAENYQTYKDVQLVMEYDQKFGIEEPSDVVATLNNKCQEKLSIGNEDYCVIPGGLHFVASEMEELNSSSSFLKPCDENDDVKKVHYCSEGSICEPIILEGRSDTFPFKCSCPRDGGLKIDNILEMNHTLTSLASGKRELLARAIRKEFCEDIDECFLSKDDCPSNSTCKNTFGSFECICPDGTKLTGGTTGVLKECLPVCHRSECKNGRCEVDPANPSNWVCKCKDGYRGRFCEHEDHKVYLFRAWLISVCVLLGLALIIAIFIARHYKNKKSGGKGMAVTSSVAVPISSSPVNNNSKEDRPHEDTHV